MRREIIISKTCQLEIESDPESTFLGWKYAIGDGGSGGASTFATLDNDSEFNRLALQSPLMQRMVEALKLNEWHYDSGLDGFYCNWCENNKKNGHSNYCLRQQLLAEIEKLEAK